MKHLLPLIIVAVAGMAAISLAQDADPFGAPAPAPSSPGQEADPFGDPTPATAKKALTIEEKLEKINIPSVDLQETPLVDCLDFLKQRSQELDSTSDPNLRGMNIVLRPLRLKEGDLSGPRVSSKLRNVSLGEAINAVAKQAGKSVWKENGAIVIGDDNQKRESVEIAEDPATMAMIAKLKATVLPSAEFLGTPLENVMLLVTERLVELEDKSMAPPASDIKFETTGKMTTFDPFFKREAERRIELTLRNVNAFDLLSHIAAQAEVGIKWGPNKIILVGD